MAGKDYVWTRREGEQEGAYAAFQAYLRLGAARSIVKAANKVGKARQTLEVWSARHDWRERARAYDVHLETASTDGLTHQIAETRDESLDMCRELRGLLRTRLEHFIERKEDPTIRFSTAVNALVRLQEHSMSIGQGDPKTSARIENIERLIMKAIGEPLP